MNGFNTNLLINPMDFYNVIFNNIDKFKDNEKFTILRFFDKISDSSEFSSSCKKRFREHIERKDLKSKASMIFGSGRHPGQSIKVLDNVVYLNRNEDMKWSFLINNLTLLRDLDDNEAFKIVKDVNNAFLILMDRREGN